MSNETTELTPYLEAIDKATWSLAHKKIELASARSQIATLTSMCQQFEEDFQHHKNVANAYIDSLTQNLAEARSWVKNLEEQLTNLARPGESKE